MVTVGFRERRIGSYWSIGTNFQFVMDDGKVLETESGGNCARVGMYLMPPNCMLNVGGLWCVYLTTIR